MRLILLDTCAAIWFAEGKSFAPEAVAAFNDFYAGRAAVLVSPITAWEVGLLVSRNRYNSPVEVPRWFDLLVENGRFGVAGMPATVLAKSSFLPGVFHGDPADRILVATAREYGHTIMTRDRKILDYAGQGLVQAIKC